MPPPYQVFLDYHDKFLDFGMFNSSPEPGDSTDPKKIRVAPQIEDCSENCPWSLQSFSLDLRRDSNSILSNFRRVWFGDIVNLASSDVVAATTNVGTFITSFSTSNRLRP